MKEKKVTYRRCKVCEVSFPVNPFKPFLPGCSIDCNMKYGRLLAEKKKAKESRDTIKVMKEKLMTHKDYLKLLQVVFNTYIRLRDKDRECVSCGCDMKGRKGDASHFYSVGGNANLRFNEDNTHLSCVPCNQFKHGNLLEYAERLPKRIGQERFERLKLDRNTPTKLSIPEIQERIKHYKQLIKEMK